jgi:hypothetical protein
MQVLGPLPVNITPDGIGKSELNLKLFQRVTAAVLEVSATQAILSVDGYPVVARLTSSDQAAILMGQRTAQFIVTQSEDQQQIILKLITPDSQQNAAETSNAPRRELVLQMLQEYGVPASEENIEIGRALMNQKLPITADLLNELSRVLGKLESWGQEEANLAATIKAAGLPLTPETFKLTAQQPANIGGQIEELMTQLKSALQGKDLPVEYKALLDAGLQTLRDVVVDPKIPLKELGQKLADAMSLLGKSPEFVMKEQIQQSSPFWPEKSLVTLLKLQQSAAQHGNQELAETITHVMKDIQQMQWTNVRVDPASQWSEWTSAALLAQMPMGTPPPTELPVRMQIQRRENGKDWSIDPENTHFVVQVDLPGGGVVQVEIGLTGRQIQASVIVPDEVLSEAAKTEMPSLRAGIEELGYEMTEPKVEVGKPHASHENHPSAGGSSSFMTVDLEI